MPLYKSLLLCALLLASLLTITAVADAQTPDSRRWVTVYYPYWAMAPLGSSGHSLPPWEVDWTGITHVIHFMNGNVSTTPPYSTIYAGSKDSIDIEFCGITNPGSGPGTWIHWQDSLITIAHRNGAKVLLSIQAVDPRNLNYVAADSARTDVLVNHLIGYITRKGYDGLELDWEGWLSPLGPASDVNRLVRRLRAGLDTMNPRGILSIAAMTGQGRLYWPSQDSMVDQYNLMCYDYVHAWYQQVRSNSSWYVAPLHRGTVPEGFEGMSIDSRGPQQWVDIGHDSKKVGCGIPTFGWVLKNVDGLVQPIASGGDYGYATYHEAIALLKNGGTEGWDEERRVPYITGTALRSEGSTGWGNPGVVAGQKFFATYESPRSMAEKAQWVKERGFGGLMIYDLTMDLDRYAPFGRRNPLTAAAIRAFVDGADMRPIASFTATPDHLPPGGGAVTLSWSTEFATGATITPGIGAVGTTGSTKVTLASSTTFRLDVSGPGGTASYDLSIAVDHPPTGQIVFDDSLRPGFTNQSWNTTAVFGCEEKSWGGRKAIRLHFMGWGGFKLAVAASPSFGAITRDRYDSLRFDVFSEAATSLRVGFGSGNGSQAAVPSQRWTKVSVPLPQTEVRDLWVQNSTSEGTTAYLDNVYFTLAGTDKTGPSIAENPVEFYLEQNYPNPFNPSTTIEYTVPVASEVSIRIYDILGQDIADLASGLHFAGRHRVTWNAQGMAGGVYFYRYETPNYAEVRKLVLVK